MSENYVTNFDVLGKNVKIKDENATAEIENIKKLLPDFEKKTDFKSNDLDVSFLSRFYRDYTYKSDTEQTIQQGCAIIDENLAVSITIDINSTYATLWKYNYRNGEILASKTGLTGFGHANDATYNVKSGYVEVALATVNGIIRINPDTLSVIDTVATSNNFTAIAYDRISDVLYCRKGNIVYKIDPLSYSIIESKTLNEPSILSDRISKNETYRQGMFAVNGLVGNMYWNPNCIIFYDFNTAEIKRYYNIPKVANEGYPIMEIESGDFYNEHQFAFVTNHNISNGYKQGTTFLECDLTKNTLTSDLYRSITSTPTTSMYLYVDATTTNNIPDGTESRPFRYLQEAINCALCRNNNLVTIQLKTAGDYGLCYVTGFSSPLRIIGTENATINGIFCERVNNVNIRNVILNPVLNGVVIRPITANQSKVSLESCTLNGYDNPHSNYCLVSNGELTMYSCSITAIKSNSYTTYFIVTEKSSVINMSATTFSSTKLPEFIQLNSGSILNKRPCDNLGYIKYNGGWCDTSCLKVCDKQSMTIGIPLTMKHTDLITNLANSHNLMQVVFNVKGSRFPVTFRIYEDTLTQQLSFTTRFSGVWYRYVIVLKVDGTSYEITPNNIIAISENNGSTYSPSNITSDSEFYPKIDSVDIMRV